VEHGHVVQALAPNRTDDALDVGPLPGRSRGAQHSVDTQVSHLSPEGIAEDGIAVAQQIARSFPSRISKSKRKEARIATVANDFAIQHGQLGTWYTGSDVISKIGEYSDEVPVARIN
jgi:hypothetical protein